MRTTNQVAVYCMFHEGGRNFFTLVKRSEKRGGFWQPVTGGEEDFDEGNILKTVAREVKEELGIKIKQERIQEIPYSFRFIDKGGIEHLERCFGILLSPKTKDSIRLSNEHTAIIHSTDVEYLKTLLRFEENRIGFSKFVELVANVFTQHDC